MKKNDTVSSDYIEIQKRISDIIRKNEELNNKRYNVKKKDYYVYDDNYNNVLISNIKKRNLKQNYIDTIIDLELKKNRKPINIYEYPSDNRIKELLNTSIIQNIRNFFSYIRKRSLNRVK